MAPRPALVEVSAAPPPPDTDRGDRREGERART
jgi:hypothetical protein